MIRLPRPPAITAAEAGSTPSGTTHPEPIANPLQAIITAEVNARLRDIVRRIEALESQVTGVTVLHRHCGEAEKCPGTGERPAKDDRADTDQVSPPQRHRGEPEDPCAGKNQVQALSEALSPISPKALRNRSFLWLESAAAAKAPVEEPAASNGGGSDASLRSVKVDGAPSRKFRRPTGDGPPLEDEPSRTFRMAISDGLPREEEPSRTFRRPTTDGLPREDEDGTQRMDAGIKSDGSASSFSGSTLRKGHTLRLSDVEEEASKKEWSYPIQNSIWDASLFIGIPAIGHAGSAFLMIGLAVNTVLQIVFSYVICVSFLKQRQLPNVEDVWEWRESHGHEFSNMPASTRASMVRAVCDGSRVTLTSSLYQHSLHSTIQNYTNTETGVIPIGALLCTAVLLSWTLAICQEMTAIKAFAMAIWNLPRTGNDNRTVLFIDETEDITIEECTLQRKIGVFILLIIRWVIAMALLVFGSIWLARTLSIEELVLNAAALAFIMGMDELIFETLAPLPTKVLIREMKPLPRPRGIEWNGLTLSAPFNLLITIIFVTSILLGFVVPNVQKMFKIDKAMCGGFKDFVVSQTPMDLVIGMDTANPYGGQREKSSFSRQLVRELVDLGATNDSSTVLDLSTYGALLTMAQASVPEFVGILSEYWLATKCGDYAFSGPDALSAVRSTLQYQLGTRAETCADLAGHCDGGSRLLRAVCPVTCGCDDPHSGLFLSGENEGCPKDLCVATATYTDRMASIPCADYNVSELSRIPGWRTFVARWSSFGSTQQPSLRQETQEAESMLLARGCDAMDSLNQRVRNLLCTSTLHTGSIRPFCPSSCGCAAEVSPGCPTQCN